jgi:probable rRNA maturation factor
MRTGQPALALTVQYVIKAEDLPARTLFRKWALAALERDAEITLRLVDDAEGMSLNRDYRGKDYAPNVLTFPLSEQPLLMGDIILCVPVVAQEAAAQNLPLDAHYAHLVAHGILHLQGYDHETESDAERMEAVESHILAKLGYADPYSIEKGMVLHG